MDAVARQEVMQLLEEARKKGLEIHSLYSNFARTPGSASAPPEVVDELHRKGVELDNEHQGIKQRILTLMAKESVDDPDIWEIDEKLRYI